MFSNVSENTIQKTFKEVINNKLQTILNLYCNKLNVKTSLEISNAKDEIFLSFNSIMPIVEQKNKHERFSYWLHNIIYGNKSEINRCYKFINELLNNNLTKDELNSFYINNVNLNIIEENIK